MTKMLLLDLRLAIGGQKQRGRADAVGELQLQMWMTSKGSTEEKVMH